MIHVGSLVALFVFYVIIFLVGIFAAWKKTRQKVDGSKTSEAMLIARRDISMLVGMFTMTAVWVGGGYITGTTEAVYSSGLIWAQAPVAYAVSTIVSGLFFAKPMREKKYVTMLDPFQQKYGARIGGLMFVPALIGEIFWSGAILASLGATVKVIVDLDFTTAVIVSAAVAVFYTFFGGQYSVCYTDVAQLILITFGLVLCTPFAWYSPYVRWNQVNSTEFANSTSADWIGKITAVEIPRYVDEYLLLILGGIPWQDYFQRVLAAKSVKNAVVLSVICGFMCLFFAVPPAILGYVALNADWDAAGFNSTELRANPQLVLPLVLQYLTPYAVAVVGLGAVAAGVMSSTDASVLSSSSMFMQNIYRNIFRPHASDAEAVWVLRGGFIVAGIIAAVLAIFDKSVYYLWVFCSDIVYVVLFPQFVCVLFVPFVNSYGVVLGSVVGLALRLLGGEEVLYIPPVLKYPCFDYEANKQIFPFKTFATLINFILTCLISPLALTIVRKYPMLDVLNILPPGNIAKDYSLREDRDSKVFDDHILTIRVKESSTSAY